MNPQPFPRQLGAIVGVLSLFLAGGLGAQNPAPTGAGATVNAPAPAASPAISYSAVHVDGPFIAMTFDDGPSAKLTPELLDILAAHHIHATFFVIGKNVIDHPEILQRAVREGHEIGNHSWSHPSLGKMRDDKVRVELQKTDDAIKAAIGEVPIVVLGGRSSCSSRRLILRPNGLAVLVRS